MDINTLITQYQNNEIVIEDVVLDYDMDGTSVHVTLCGPYGLELCDETIAHNEIDSLKETLKDVNFITE